MKITIKNIKYSAFASEETHCFQATVYVDGKRAFGVKNDGHGGPDDYFSVDDRPMSDIWKQIKAIDAEVGKETYEFHGTTLKRSLEGKVCELVNEWHRMREAKKTLKKIAYIGKGGAVYTLPAKYKPTEKNLEGVQQAKWWRKSYQLLNTMPIEKVMELM